VGLFSGSASYVRYRITGEVPEAIKPFALEKLQWHAFHEIDPGTLTDKSTGWVSAENMSSTKFDDMHFAKDPYLVFSLRVDTRRLPPIALRAAVLREELKTREETGRERLNKKQKMDIREEQAQRLIKKVLPLPAVYDVCWNMNAGEILFFSTSKKANEDFVSFFYRSFDLKLRALTPAVLAAEARPGAEEQIKKETEFLSTDHG
jgi:DNA recombination-dependent growth factor C